MMILRLSLHPSYKILCKRLIMFPNATKHLSRHKWKDEERVIFETEEEAIIAQNIIEEVSGYL